MTSDARDRSDERSEAALRGVARENERRGGGSGDDRYPAQVCEVCDTVMYGLHCKIVCPNCGYKRDCSDP